MNEIVNEREKVYGNPEVIHSRIAEVWSGILGNTVTAGDVALCMIGLKLVRAQHNPDHCDSIDDVEGYAEIFRRISGDAP